VLKVSQEQQEPAKEVEQRDAGEREAAGEPGEPTVSPPKKKRVVKRVPKIDEEAISPRQSYWPLALALALVVMLMGAVTNSISILAIGVVLVCIAILGWSFERR
jgi:cytochrome c oxidase subunit IV